MHLKYVLTADYANLTADGKLNLLGVFTEINPPGFDFTLPLMYVIAALVADADDFGQVRRVQIVLGDPANNQIVATPPVEIVVPAPNQPGREVGLNQVAGLGNVTFHAGGEYILSIVVDDRVIDHASLYVNDPVMGG